MGTTAEVKEREDDGERGLQRFAATLDKVMGKKTEMVVR